MKTPELIMKEVRDLINGIRAYHIGGFGSVIVFDKDNEKCIKSLIEFRDDIRREVLKEYSDKISRVGDRVSSKYKSDFEAGYGEAIEDILRELTL
jgi:hypothetical protein